MKKIKILELFGGIGACTQAFINLEIPHEIVDYVEIDNHAVKSYNAINKTHYKPQNIADWDKDLDVDLIMHGSPCQDFSIAGRNKGASEGGTTRSSLMYETIRIVNKLKPQYVIWENVKNILSKKHRHNFDNYLNQMNELGYTNYYKVLNAKNYEVPQSRNRVFVISMLKDMAFEFPEPKKLQKNVLDILENNVEDKYYVDSKKTLDMIKGMSSNNIDRLNEYIKMQDNKKHTCTTKQSLERFDTVCLNSKGGRGGIEGLQPSLQDRVYDPNYIMPAIATCYNPNIFLICGDSIKIRKLTPKECWRLMGRSDSAFHRAESVSSDS